MLEPLEPLHVDEASLWQRGLLGVRYRIDPRAAVRAQLRRRDASYIAAWEREDDVDLHLAFKVAAILKHAWKWPNDFFIPADPFALLNPVNTGAFDDGMDAVDCVIEIEHALGVHPLADSFWHGAYPRSLADVVRFLEAEMSVRR